jgi:NAD(P)-dependent dehydrogenase (short-subunit alcohol dehydrogenase family)
MAATAHMDIAGQVCLIPGGTSGLGRAIALRFAEAGAHVVTGSRSEDKVKAAREDLQAAAAEGAQCEALPMNVTDEASVTHAVQQTAQQFGRLDAVINCSGIIQKTAMLEMSTDDFDDVVRTNLTGSFIVAREAAKVMKDQPPRETTGQRGSMVMIASLNSYISLSDVTAYAASKSGVLGLIRGMANEWAQYGLRINGIAPGVFPTELNRPLIEGTPRGEWLLNHTPLGRFGEAEEIVGAANYLISDAASYTNGHTIVVDGGFLARGVGE